MSALDLPPGKRASGPCALSGLTGLRTYPEGGQIRQPVEGDGPQLAGRADIPPDPAPEAVPGRLFNAGSRRGEVAHNDRDLHELLDFDAGLVFGGKPLGPVPAAEEVVDAEVQERRRPVKR